MRTAFFTLLFLLITSVASATPSVSICSSYNPTTGCSGTSQTVEGWPGAAQTFHIDYDDGALPSDFAGFTAYFTFDPDYPLIVPTSYSLNIDDSEVSRNECIEFTNQTPPSGLPDNTSVLICYLEDDDGDSNLLDIVGGIEASLSFVYDTPVVPVTGSVFQFTGGYELYWTGSAIAVRSWVPSSTNVYVDFECAADSDYDLSCDDDDDNCVGVANFYQRDDDEDGYGNLCDSDVGQDCVVGGGDVSETLSHLTESAPYSPSYDGAFDVTEDGVTGGPDVSKVFSDLTKSPGPSSRSCADCTATPGTGVCP